MPEHPNVHVRLAGETSGFTELKATERPTLGLLCGRLIAGAIVTAFTMATVATLAAGCIAWIRFLGLA